MNNNQQHQQSNQPHQGPQWHGQPPAAGQASHLPPTPPYVQPAKQRNWFLRHKILTGLGALLLVGGIAAGASGGSKSNDAATADTSSAAVADTGSSDSAASSAPAASSAAPAAKTSQAKQEKKQPGVGTPVRDGKFEFTVTKVKTGVTSVGDQYLGKKAQGQFVLVSVTVKNIGNESQTMFDDNQKLTDTQGRTFSTDTEASIYLKSNDLWMSEINPGNTASGTLIFDMPAGSAPASLELHDSAFSGGVTVSLR